MIEYKAFIYLCWLIKLIDLIQTKIPLKKFGMVPRFITLDNQHNYLSYFTLNSCVLQQTSDISQEPKHQQIL